jgi:hypothetical protein
MKQEITLVILAILLLIFVMVCIIAFLNDRIELRDLLALLSIFPLIGLALFQENIKRFLSSPNLTIIFELKEPICIKCPAIIKREHGVKEDSAYYFRFKVRNVGKSRAKNCECYIESLNIETDNEWITVDNFQPMKLQWSNRADKEFVDIEANSYGSFCDLVHVCRYDIVERNSSDLFIDYGLGVSLPFSQQTRLAANRRYKLNVVIYSENAASEKATFEIYFTGKWQDQPKDMFKEISIKPCNGLIGYIHNPTTPLLIL